MAERHPYLALLLVGALCLALLIVARLTGIAVGRFGIVRRNDNPEAFDGGLLLAGFFIGAVLLIAAFGELAKENSERLTTSYLENLQRDSAGAKAGSGDAYAR